MDVHPRIKIPPPPPDSKSSAPPKEETPEPKADEPAKKDDKGLMSTLRENSFVIFIFGVIIIGLLVLIAYLVTKNNSYFSWFKNSKDLDKGFLQAAPPANSKKKPSSSHKDIVAGVSNEELAKYAKMAAATEAPKPEAKPEAKPTAAPEAKPEAKDVKIDVRSDPPKPAAKQVTFGQDHVISIDDVDNEMERELNNRINEATIADLVSEQIQRMSTERFRRIEQLGVGGAVLRTFDSADAVFDAGFDYNEVVKCCANPALEHKTFKWKFADK